ncbi:MAG: 4Fe-4S dicluster domain-containing protein [Deltaproteobacteria bacterium]|nr:4Fe-4S dicluster domain-containing protein [Deltaproteobacteria bacterium]
MVSFPALAVQGDGGISGYVFMWIIAIVALTTFAFIIRSRIDLLLAGQKDPRFSNLKQRFLDLVEYGFIQKRQPRYLWAGVIHIMIFWGFVVLGLRSLDLVTEGLGFPIFRPFMHSPLGPFYNALKDVFELIVLVACIWAILRRAIVKPERYEGSHTVEAYLVLGLISFLMITDMLFEGSGMLLTGEAGEWLPAAWIGTLFLPENNPGALSVIFRATYWLHILAFFVFLNMLPLFKHFHIITALPNVFFRKQRKGEIKPARYGVDDIFELETLGVEKIEDFTWKHILDLYTCTECGRCTDNCPANTIGRPLSPKEFTIKLRDHAYEKYPILPSSVTHNKQEEEPAPMVGGIIGLGELWSCTTCGACEEECPVFIEYIDKIIDMRRHVLETSRNPKTFNQILMFVEKTGNPFGKPAAKRADWVKEQEAGDVKILKEGDRVDVLYYVDGYASFDPQSQKIAASIVKGLKLAGMDFGILGKREKDTGHQVRRMGEEGLFQVLVEENTETLSSINFKWIVTTDPHAYNALKKDYPKSYKVFHYTQFFLSLVETGHLRPQKAADRSDLYTYHDPCYLGRHNGVYEAPRRLLQSIPELRLVEMAQSRDRSFCCGGGDVVLWHEIEQEEMRMAEKRVRMALDTGANVMVTACPFCFIHFEDAIKTGGFEDRIRVVDLMELFMAHS